MNAIPVANTELTGAPTGAEPACPNFDGLARIYRWMELATFGPLLQRCRCEWIDKLSSCRNALVLGDGDGRFTKRLLDVNPLVTIEAVDASEAMLRALERRAEPHRDRVCMLRADLRRWHPQEKRYDLVVSHFFLDCLETEDVESLAWRVRDSVADGAVWVVSEFAVPTTQFGRLVAGPMVAGLYRAFGLLTGLAVRRLPDYSGALSRAGFQLEARRKRLGGLLVSDLWGAAGPHDPQIHLSMELSTLTECYNYVNVLDIRSRQTEARRIPSP